MDKRNKTNVLNFLDKILFEGCASITKLELCNWYGHERLTKAITDDIAEKWSEIIDDLPKPLSGNVNKKLKFFEESGRIVFISRKTKTLS